jgi:hypothetical protein
MWFIGCDVGVVGILERVWQLDHAPVLDHGADGRMDGADARRCAGRLDGLGERVTRCPEKQGENCAEGTRQHPALLQVADESQRIGTGSGWPVAYNTRPLKLSIS